MSDFRSRLDTWPWLITLHKAILLIVFAVAAWLVRSTWSGPLGLTLLIYLILNGISFTLMRRLKSWHTMAHALSYLSDLALSGALIFFSGGFRSPFWPVIGLQAILPAFYLPSLLWIWLGAFFSGPLYVLVLWLHSQSLAFLADSLFIARYSVLFSLTIITFLTADRIHQQQRESASLRETLATREADLDAQAKRLQRTAADLGERVLQLRAFQEIARALATTLDLSETLHVLVDRLVLLAGAQHAAIALLDNDGTTLRGVAASGLSDPAIQDFSVPVDEAMRNLLTSGAAISGNDARSTGFEQLRKLWQMESFTALCLPLVLRGHPIGTLYLADSNPDFDNERQRQLLDSFSYYAAAAIENAQLYQAVADKSRELETILAGIGDGVLVVDAELRLVLMNPVAAQIFALGIIPTAGTPIHQLLPNHALIDFLAEVKNQPTTAAIREIELTPLGHRDPQIYQALAAPLMVGASLQGIATVLRDITSQKELEKMKSNFLSVVSHELKTPLHSIKGFVDIILMNKTGPITEIQRDFLETVKQQTNHLQRMIDDLLEFSRLESGRVSLRLSPVDIPVVVEAVVDKLTPLADTAEVTLINLVPENLSTISADPWRLEQVVTNLVDNAIKFTPVQGTVTILAEEREDVIQVSVQDTGIGIPPGQHERVFDRFYQIDGGVNRLYKGTGLGLTICRHIVEHHGGRIWVESDYGHGATFHFTISKHLQSDDIGALDFTTLPA
ncbi:MAG: GAF domain-containing protein [Chloroflexi bacterium]|nr:GAF domain-containing protein [Chloroflexota bacterium]